MIPWSVLTLLLLQLPSMYFWSASIKPLGWWAAQLAVAVVGTPTAAQKCRDWTEMACVPRCRQHHHSMKKCLTRRRSHNIHQPFIDPRDTNRIIVAQETSMHFALSFVAPPTPPLFPQGLLGNLHWRRLFLWCGRPRRRRGHFGSAGAADVTRRDGGEGPGDLVHPRGGAGDAFGRRQGRAVVKGLLWFRVVTMVLSTGEEQDRVVGEYEERRRVFDSPVK